MRVDRHLSWDGCVNARDLGGLPLAGGGRTRWGAVVRSDSLDRLTAEGWSAVRAHGVRTIIDLRNDDERETFAASEAGRRRAGVTSRHLPLEDPTDTEFWERWRGVNCTPLYYRALLEHRPERPARIIGAIAEAEPGGVVVHCGIGRDRTGMIVAVLLALAGVAPDEIATDHELSTERLGPLLEEMGRADERSWIDGLLADAGTTARASITSTVESLEAEPYLLSGGLTSDAVDAVRRRLVDSPVHRSR